MPTKPNYGGEQQNYVPQGNGDPSGEYADEGGGNINFKSFGKPSSPIAKAVLSHKEAKKPEPKDDKALIKKAYPSFSQAKLDKASPTEIAALKKAFKEKAEYEEANAAASNLNSKGVDGIWYGQTVYPSDFAEKEKSIPSKEGYYKNKIAAATDEKTKSQMTEMLGKIDQYVKDSKAYSEAMKKAESLSKKAESAQKVIDLFEDDSSPYSEIRKKKAVWVKGGVAESQKVFLADAEKQWKSFTPSEKKILHGYTGSYSYINEPLRHIKYAGSKADFDKFKKDVTAMTSAIDKCSYGFDCWVQRGLWKLSVGGKSLSEFTDTDQKSLVGMTFRDEGFLSCGSSKGTGFVANPIIMNIYCPKGTKMHYIQPQSSFSGENETIIQRGYTYKITKVEKKDGKTYLDVEAVLWSDSQKQKVDESLSQYYYQ